VRPRYSSCGKLAAGTATITHTCACRSVDATAVAQDHRTAHPLPRGSGRSNDGRLGASCASLRSRHNESGDLRCKRCVPLDLHCLQSRARDRQLLRCRRASWAQVPGEPVAVEYSKAVAGSPRPQDAPRHQARDRSLAPVLESAYVRPIGTGDTQEGATHLLHRPTCPFTTRKQASDGAALGMPSLGTRCYNTRAS
jgi:hypothetical protein